jgi:hypothetical protein
MAGVHLSYIALERQATLANYVKETGFNVSVGFALALRNDTKITTDEVHEQKKEPKKAAPSVIISSETYTKYFAGTDKSEVADIVEAALEMYFVNA